MGARRRAVDGFLQELTELSKKWGIAIDLRSRCFDDYESEWYISLLDHLDFEEGELAQDVVWDANKEEYVVTKYTTF